MIKIYLAGGIKDMSKEVAIEWRTKATEKLHTFQCLNPMRRDFRESEFQSQNEIVQLDKADIINADILLVNATKPSWGTAMEVLFAFQKHKIIVTFTGDNFENTSSWLAFHATRITKTLDEALEYIKVNF